MNHLTHSIDKYLESYPIPYKIGEVLYNYYQCLVLFSLYYLYLGLIYYLGPMITIIFPPLGFGVSNLLDYNRTYSENENRKSNIQILTNKNIFNNSYMPAPIDTIDRLHLSEESDTDENTSINQDDDTIQDTNTVQNNNNTQDTNVNQNTQDIILIIIQVVKKLTNILIIF